MARKKPSAWPAAHRRYHPARQPGFNFEKLEEARKRDAKRSRAVAAHPDLAAAHRKLIRSLAKPKRHPRNMASARYIRRRRISFNSQLNRLIARRRGPVRFFTLIPRRWLIPTDQIADTTPGELLEQIRSTLNRAGIGRASGWLVMVLDVEYIAHLDAWSFHLHGLAAGGKARAIKTLRAKPKFKSAADHQDVGKRPVQIKRVRSGTEPRVVNYLIKTYFGMRVYHETNGKMRRGKGHLALPDRLEAEFLVWLSKWSFDDFVLTNGLYLGKKCLQISTRRVLL